MGLWGMDGVGSGEVQVTGTCENRDEHSDSKMQGIS